MNMKNIYKQLTDIDIKEQKQIWDERGKGYYGEYLLFCELYKSIAGNGKILMNLNVPADNARTTEIDLIMIHETGVYVFEIKHYKGTIYGKDTDAIWTQYFRTAPNSVFKNPVLQNNYHIEVLKKLLPGLPIFSGIVFTNSECQICVTNENENVDICKLESVCRQLEYRFSQRQTVLSMELIDNVFRTLSAFSQMKEPVEVDGEAADFFSWVQPAIKGLEAKKAEVEEEKQKWIADTEELKKTKKKGIFGNVAVAILCIVLSVLVTTDVTKKNNRELDAFKQNFLHVDEIGNEYIDSLQSYVTVSNVSIQPFSDDAVTFTARIAMANDTYGIALTENSKYIVMTASGTVIEYNVFGEHLSYSKISNTIGRGYREYGDLQKAHFFGITQASDILYIKITGVELLKMNTTKVVIKDKLEIELYSK